MRFLRLLLLTLCITSLLLPATAEAAKRSRAHGKRAAAAASGVNDPRYAALVMDPVTGEVYHAKDADALRYPASLTKMMTLYLLFEALEKKELSMGTRLRVSDYATTMPQTHLSLNSGDGIPVETAIKALVIRSANDVAVVVAEALGGDVDRFAEMMTAKARALGMRHTVFQNPHGLPNSDQVTTALDMAKLGIALKRDFPRYYHYFSAREFSWAGTTYYTHNRVMLRYAGVDGIKTGFIGKSGFNLVTSSVRGGRPLVGVVLGGGSGRWRDDRMITLLNQTYTVVAKRGAAKGKIYAANLPIAKGGAVDTNPDVDTDTPEDTKPLEDTPAKLTVATPEPKKSPPVAPQAPVFVASKPALVVAEAKPVEVPAAPKLTDWGIQVGAFSTRAMAEKAAQVAYAAARTELRGALVSVVAVDTDGVQTYRARLRNITEYQATKACQTLGSTRTTCFTYRVDEKDDSGAK